MSKNMKRVYLTLAIALLIGMGLYTYLNHIPKAEAFGYESMVFCIITPVRDKDLLRKVPIAYSFQCARAVPLAYSRRNSMQLMPHKDS